MTAPVLADIYEMVTVAFEDGDKITGRVKPTPHGGYVIEHVEQRARAITLFCEYEEME